jgi:8-oxo-dGTP pyrophosphatase MutT (NUDIX family)
VKNDKSSAIHDAATIIVYRTKPTNQIFMVRRHSKASFMANAMVFPGGRLDEADGDPRWLSHVEVVTNTDEDNTAVPWPLHVAAIRETFEEAGVLLANREGKALEPNSPVGRVLFGDARRALNAGDTSFLSLCEEYQLNLTLPCLTYYSRWITPVIEKRRFDARFFSAPVPALQTPLHDQKETTHGAWLAPAEALALYGSDQIQLAPPTLRILTELSNDWTSINRAAMGASVPMAPQAIQEDDELHLVLPGDPQYVPAGCERNRIVLRNGRWMSIGRGA